MTEPAVADVRIRLARTGDAGCISNLNKALGYEASESEMYKRLDQLIANPIHRVLVATFGDNQDVVGWISAEQRMVLESGCRVDIAGLIVSKDARRRSAGRQLVAGIEDWAAALGIARIRVNCNLKRSDAHAFYQRIGFQETKRQASYFKEVAR